MAKRRPLFYSVNLRGLPIQFHLTPLLSILLGLCVGSFLNVCLYRWKSGGQILTPSSFCPHCKKSIYWFDNIPLLGYFFLAGKCRFCRTPISVQYPLVEAISALLFFSVMFVFPDDSFLQVKSFVFIGFLVLLVASDLKWRLLPHLFNNLFILSGFFFGLRDENINFLVFYKMASGFVVMGAIVLGLVRFFPQGLGGGDVKMLMALSVWMGFMKSFYILILAFGAGSLVVLPLLLTKKLGRKSMIPFGPFLAFASLILWFWPGTIDRLRIAL